MSTYEQRQNLQQLESEDKARKRNSHISKKRVNDKATSSNKKLSSKKSFAIMRIQKLKTFAQITSAGKHVNRLQNTPNANPELTANNRQLLGSGDLSSDVKAHIEANVESKIRKNAVLCIEQLLTASPEYFQNDPENKKLNRWVNAQIQYIKKEWGDNCVSAVLHLDESTPHIHAHIVPVVNNKLNQKALVGGSKFRLVEMQDEYADVMQHLQLERGISNTKAKHTTINAFYKNIEQQQEVKQIKIINSLKNILNPSAAFAAATADLQKELQVKTTELNALQLQLQNAKQRSLQVNKIKKDAEGEVVKVKEEIENLKSVNNDLRCVNNQLINEQAIVNEKIALFNKYEQQINELIAKEQEEMQKQQAAQHEKERQAARAEYYKNNKNTRSLSR